MKIKWFVIMILLIFSVSFALSVIIIKNNHLLEVNLISINEVVKKAEENWGHLSEEIFTDSDVHHPFAIIDQHGNVMYQTSDTFFINVYETIKNRDTVIDIKNNNEIVGKVVIRNNEKETIDQMKNELILSISIIFAILTVIIIGFVFYINSTLLKPFHKLEKFAANVARGNLEIPLKMDRNNTFGAFTESFDIMREELQTARQREYESNQSKKELVATLSHDIKTPVASIKAISELMLIQVNEEKVRKQLNTIYSKAEQINLLVTDMFHATLEELQQLKLHVVEESSEILVDMIESVNYDDNVRFDHIPPCIILTDIVRMQQVLDNVISNSYKYAGTPVSITSQINQGYLELHISDFGPGISEAELPLLFNKYYRGKKVEGTNGSGLGLYISKYFMENMHGKISCYNRKDGFTVVLSIKLA